MSRWAAVAALLATLATSGAQAAERVAVMGRVIDQEGQPLEGASVEFEGRLKHSVNTDAKGEYGLLLSPARYRITVTMEGYQGAEFEYEIRAGDPNRLPTVDLTSLARIATAEAKAIEGQFGEASALAAEKRFDEAIAIYGEIMAARPDLADPHYNVAVILAQERDWPGAEKALHAALERAPDHLPATVLLARIYESTDRPAQATATLEKAALAHPEDAGVQLSLGYLYINGGRSEDARVVLEKAAELDPEKADAHYLLATLATSRSDYASAVDLLERYLELAPEDGQYRGQAAGMLPALREYVDKQPETASQP